VAVVIVTIAPLGTASTEPLPVRWRAGRAHSPEPGPHKHELTAMGSIIEGNLDEILPVLREMHEQPVRAGSRGVSTLIRSHDRRDKPGSIEGKIRSVQREAGGVASPGSQIAPVGSR